MTSMALDTWTMTSSKKQLQQHRRNLLAAERYHRQRDREALLKALRLILAITALMFLVALALLLGAANSV